MLFISKIFQQIVMTVNSLIDKMDRKQQDVIKQGFLFVGFILIVIAIINGVRMGKSSAKKDGIQLATDINKTFEIDIKQNRDDAIFKKILEDVALPQNEIKETPKESFSSIKDSTLEIKNDIIEKDDHNKNNFNNPTIDKDNLSEIPHDDNRPVENNDLKRFDIEKKKMEPEIIKNEKKQLNKETELNNTNKSKKKNLNPIINQDIVE